LEGWGCRSAHNYFHSEKKGIQMQSRFNFCRRMRGCMKYLWGAAVFTWIGVIGLPVVGYGQMPRKNAVQLPETYIRTKMSLLHVGSNDSFNPTSDGTQAARLLLGALENKGLDKAHKAIEIYDAIIPRENYGGEYTALQWFAQYLVSSKSEKPTFLSDPFVAEFFYFFADNDFSALKEYLKRKYNLENVDDRDTRTGQERHALLEDTILFNNPRREQWERTSQILKALKLKKGAVIADVGSGPGYFTYRFSGMVGDQGRVFAIDTVQRHLEYIDHFRRKFGMQNITTVHTDGKTIGLAGEKVDAVFLCSLYHNIYGMASLEVREQFLNSIKSALKADGTLYLVDNGLVEPGTLPYHGPYIAKALIVAQLDQYGFDLVEQHQPIVQRYMLVFKLRGRAKIQSHLIHR
jgi:ubiquinone/menaquinone biosynthesis C-methylase UbiE